MYITLIYSFCLNFKQSQFTAIFLKFCNTITEFNGKINGKMASYRKKGDKWEAAVNLKGIRKSKLFRVKREAELWAADIERSIDSGVAKIPQITFGELLEEYANRVSAKKRSADKEAHRVRSIQHDEISEVMLSKLSSNDIAMWRDRRLKEVTGSSVIRDMNLISHCLRVAVKEWKYLPSSPMDGVTWPKKNPARTKLISDHEIEMLLTVMHGNNKTISGRVSLAFQFALETAMRAGEICNLKPEDINWKDSTAHLRETKSGMPRHVPLSTRAKEILKHALNDNTVFGLTASQLDANFRRAKKLAGLTDLHFHDARATALTKLAKILNPLELSRVAGHSGLEMLVKVYYRETAADIAKKLV